METSALTATAPAGAASPDMDEVFVLDPDWNMVPDDGRAVLVKRDPGTALMGLIPTPRAVLTCLFDGQRTIKQVIEVLAYLNDSTHAEAAGSVTKFLTDSITPMVKVRDLPAGKKVRKYDPRVFSKCGPSFSTKRYKRVPSMVLWMPTFNCYTDCLYCYMGRRYIPECAMLPEKRVQELLDEMSDMMTAIVNIGGGDPFMYPGIVDAVATLVSKDIFVAQLSTKVPIGKSVISRLGDAGIRDLQISIDGNSAEICDFLMRRKGWFDKMVQTIRDLVDAGIEVTAHVILNSYNIDCAYDTVLFLYALGVKNIRLANYGRTISHHQERLWVTKQQAKALFDRMDELRAKCPGALLHYNGAENDFNDAGPEEKTKNWPPKALCTGYSDSLMICPDGACYACEQMPQLDEFFMGSVRDASIYEVWTSEKTEALRYPPKEFFKGTVCYDCADFQVCHDDWSYCFRDAYFAYGTIYAPTPRCPKAPQGRRLTGCI